MKNKIPAFLLSSRNGSTQAHGSNRSSLTFLDRTLHKAAKVLQSMHMQGGSASENNVICKLNPFVKVLAFIYLIVIISLAGNILSQGVVTLAILIMYVIAKINLLSVYRKIVSVAFIFGFLVFLPAALNVITPGPVIINLMSFNHVHHFWIYHIPANIGITMEGCRVVVLLFLRVLNSVSLALLMAYTTPLAHVLKVLRIFYVPDTFLMIVSLAYKYIFILATTVEDTYLSLKSRLTGSIKTKGIRTLVAGRMLFIFRRSTQNYELTYIAMVSRGYTGKVKLAALSRPGIMDAVWLLLVVAFGIGVILL
ncbi:MAG: energy-coupling factor transporter transmembrane component T [Bacteroidetes bacterium]|nr:energy-coupling factor transporter transmembrane component T [Bacteroidota bacterium]